MKDDQNHYWAQREAEFQLRSVVRERDALQKEVLWLRRQLDRAMAQLDNAYARYHDMTIAQSELVDRALDSPRQSTYTYNEVGGRKILVLKDPLLPRAPQSAHPANVFLEDDGRA